MSLLFILAFFCPMATMYMIPYNLGGAMVMVDSRDLGLSQPVIDLLKKGLPLRAQSKPMHQLPVHRPQSNVDDRRLNAQISATDEFIKRHRSSIPFTDDGHHYESKKVIADDIIKRIVSYIETEIGNQPEIDIHQKDKEQRSDINLEKLEDNNRINSLRSFESFIDDLIVELDNNQVEKKEDQMETNTNGSIMIEELDNKEQNNKEQDNKQQDNKEQVDEKVQNSHKKFESVIDDFMIKELDNNEQDNKEQKNKEQKNKEQNNKEQNNKEQNNKEQNNKEQNNKEQKNKKQDNKQQGNKQQGNKIVENNRKKFESVIDDIMKLFFGFGETVHVVADSPRKTKDKSRLHQKLLHIYEHTQKKKLTDNKNQEENNETITDDKNQEKNNEPMTDNKNQEKNNEKMTNDTNQEKNNEKMTDDKNQEKNNEPMTDDKNQENNNEKMTDDTNQEKHNEKMTDDKNQKKNNEPKTDDKNQEKNNEPMTDNKNQEKNNEPETGDKNQEKNNEPMTDDNHQEKINETMPDDKNQEKNNATEIKGRNEIHFTVEKSRIVIENDEGNDDDDQFFKNTDESVMEINRNVKGKTMMIRYLDPSNHPEKLTQQLSSRSNTQVQSPFRIFINGRLQNNMYSSGEDLHVIGSQVTNSELLGRSNLPLEEELEVLDQDEEIEQRVLEENNFLDIIHALNLKFDEKIEDNQNQDQLPETDSESTNEDVIQKDALNNEKPIDEETPNTQKNNSRKPKKPVKMRSDPLTHIRVRNCQCGVPLAKRIVGGQDARIVDHPWVVQIVDENKIHFCGGTLINDRFVLTAAHCLEPSLSDTPEKIGVTLGSITSGNGIFKRVVHIFVHEGYDESVGHSFNNDIALLQFREKLTEYSDEILPICLETGDIAIDMRDGIVAGWGSTDGGFGPESQSTILQEADVTITDRDTCLTQSSYMEDTLPQNHICAGSDTTDSCQGDSGGPLTFFEVDRYYQTGIVSFGRSCVDDEFPGGYTRVHPYLPWILENTRRARYCLFTGRQTTVQDYINEAVEDFSAISTFLTTVTDELKNMSSSSNTFEGTVVITDETKENITEKKDTVPDYDGFGLEPVDEVKMEMKSRIELYSKENQDLTTIVPELEEEQMPELTNSKENQELTTIVPELEEEQTTELSNSNIDHNINTNSVEIDAEVGITEEKDESDFQTTTFIPNEK